MVRTEPLPILCQGQSGASCEVHSEFDCTENECPQIVSHNNVHITQSIDGALSTVLAGVFEPHQELSCQRRPA